MTKNQKFRHLDLFSGIGGFSLAASWVWGSGHEIVSFCEIEKFPQNVLKKHWPDVPIHDDIKTMKGDQYGRIDLLTGGFPCQPYSTAGKQRGSEDDRVLWPEMFRVIKEAKPNWVIGENVANFKNMGLDDCLSDLDSEGYETTTFIISSGSLGARHKRDRVWVLANANKIRHGRIQQQLRIFSKKNNRCSNVTSGVGFYGVQNGIWDVWKIEPKLARVADGVSSRMDRGRGIGNSISPQVVMPIMMAIKQIESYFNDK